MKELLLESFKQNPKALETLLATGNAELTHTQDKTKWGKEFPKLLMEVREELKEDEKDFPWNDESAGAFPNIKLDVENKECTTKIKNKKK